MFPRLRENCLCLDLGTLAYNHSYSEAEARRSQVQSQPEQQYEFKARLGNLLRAQLILKELGRGPHGGVLV